jgi:hypothetical protein
VKSVTVSLLDEASFSKTVSMTAKNDKILLSQNEDGIVLSEQETVLRIVNNSSLGCEYNNYFTLEKKIGDKWRELQPDAPITVSDPIIRLGGRAAGEWTFSYWNYYASQITAGDYRIVKPTGGSYAAAYVRIAEET